MLIIKFINNPTCMRLETIYRNEKQISLKSKELSYILFMWLNNYVKKYRKYTPNQKSFVCFLISCLSNILHSHSKCGFISNANTRFINLSTFYLTVIIFYSNPKFADAIFMSVTRVKGFLKILNTYYVVLKYKHCLHNISVITYSNI